MENRFKKSDLVIFIKHTESKWSEKYLMKKNHALCNIPIANNIYDI